MSREVRRVPLDFDWPLNKVWGGYLMPEDLHEDTCPDCHNGGTPAYDWLMKVAYVIAGLSNDARQQALGRTMHPWLVPLRDISYGGPTPRPGPQFAEFVKGIAPDVRLDGLLGPDVHGVFEALLKAAGLPDRWGYCPTCNGHGTVERYPGQRAEAEAWEGTEPPTGEGWQAWETVSEGSPITPVFATSEELVEHIVRHGLGGIASNINRAQAEAFVSVGYSIATMVMTGDGRMIDGVSAVHELREED